MPRPRSIHWERRISIFLDYRKRGRIYPTAKHFNIARSTVRAIVDEFVEMGFSGGPRPNLSQALLVQAQEMHLTEVMDRRGVTPTLRLAEPKENAYGGLNADQALSESAPTLAEQHDPLPLHETLIWHLSGTGASDIIEEARVAVREYDLACLSLWLGISNSLKNLCELPVRVYNASRDRTQRPCLYHVLVDLAYKEVLGVKTLSRSPVSRWRSDSTDPTLLINDAGELAHCGIELHAKIKEGVTSFLFSELAAYQSKGQELLRLHGDLRYLEAILADALSSVSDQDVRKGICPSCPYPENLPGQQL